MSASPDALLLNEDGVPEINYRLRVRQLEAQVARLARDLAMAHKELRKQQEHAADIFELHTKH